MTLLTAHGKPLSTNFSRLGQNGADLTAGLGLLLSRSPLFLAELLAAFGIDYREGAKHEVRFQAYDTREGSFSDLELWEDGHLLLVLEAKHGWDLPSLYRLQTYAMRFEGGQRPDVIAVLSACHGEFAKNHLPDGLPYCCWRDLHTMVQKIYRGARDFSEMQALKEFQRYLEEVLKSSREASNMGYCVELSADRIDGSSFSQAELVDAHGKFFFPIAVDAWPKDPPAFVIFRDGGAITTVHRVEGFERCEDQGDCHPGLPAKKGKYYVLHLGAGVPAPRTLAHGEALRGKRFWLHLDSLPSSRTVEEAIEASAVRYRGRAA